MAGNPTHQALTTTRNSLAATADSLREREFTQQRQLNSADSKIRRLTALGPTYENLLRERETLKLRLNSYNAKEQESLVDAQQAEARAENVKLISKAEFANKGRNMRKLAWLGATAAWGLILAFIAMIRVFLDPRLYAVPGAARSVPMQQSMVDLGPVHDPIPEAVPVYDPGHRPAANPYEAQPAAYAADPYAQSGYAQPGYTDTGYTDAGYADYGQQAYADPYAPVPQAQPAPQGQYAGNTAVDLSYNPYATGEVQAGSLDGTPPYTTPQG